MILPNRLGRVTGRWEHTRSRLEMRIAIVLPSPVFIGLNPDALQRIWRTCLDHGTSGGSKLRLAYTRLSIIGLSNPLSTGAS
jgi:hypothetical protein